MGLGNINDEEYHADVFIESDPIPISTNSITIIFQRENYVGLNEYYGIYNFRIMVESCP